MNRIARFEKVSMEQFGKDCRALMFDYPDSCLEKIYNEITLPKRATSGSAGYDFITPFELVIHPGEKVLVPSGIRCHIENGYCMLGFVRSSMGIKKDISLSNGTIVLDGDYYNADNEGHIMISLRNVGSKTFKCAAGDRIIQGVFLPIGITEDDQADGVRTGGIGSTSV